MNDRETSQAPNYHALMGKAVLEIKDLKRKLLHAEREQSNEPIAVIGMGCRFPGGANSITDYWELLRNGIDTIREVPTGRWETEHPLEPHPDAPGTVVTRLGGFIDDLEGFDASFFGISPREAEVMDPHQRVLLEVCREALENAQIVPEDLFGTNTGVFVGASSMDNVIRLIGSDGLEEIGAYHGTGCALSVIAGRVSYIFGLNGPSFVVDTACSSSLLSLHLAAESLRRQECNMALAGGVHFLFHPGISVAFSKANMLAPDGHCKTFDASADGYVRGEGCGMLVLKRLSDAKRDGDHVLAVLRGSAVNQDGASGGLTVPSGPSQERVIRQALKNAKLSPDAVDYIEAHGTGTSLGDPIEIGAIGNVFGKRKLMVGSVKTNLGHLEAAAGIASAIKVILALNNKAIPPHLNLNRPNPLIPWDETGVEVPTSLTPWEIGERERVAGISSFGFSGTNVHMIFSEAQNSTTLPASEPEKGPNVLCLSARNDESLRALAMRWIKGPLASDDAPIGSLCANALALRHAFPQRHALIAHDAVSMRRELAAFSKDGRGTAAQQGGMNFAFLFTGQGAQYAGMGRELYAKETAFRVAMDECDALFTPELGRSLCDLIFEPENSEDIHLTGNTQPALFAFEYALAKLWQSWGVTPTAMLGHSVGEYVAAVLAGVFSLADGTRLIAARARLMQDLPAGGTMAAVLATEQTVVSAIAALAPSHQTQISIAAINGVNNTVVSGSAQSIAAALLLLAGDGIEYRMLTVSHAFHSPLMDPMLEAFHEVASTITFARPSFPIVSNITGRLAGDEIATPDYWVSHVRKPVRFADGVKAAEELNCGLLLEIGPAATLTTMARRVSESLVCVPSLRRDSDPLADIALAAGVLWSQGVEIKPPQRGEVRRDLALPTYAFYHRSYWKSVRIGSKAKASLKGMVENSHPLLGERIDSPALAQQVVFAAQLATDNLLSHHRIFGQAVLPAAAHVEIALAAAREAIPAESGEVFRLEEMEIDQAIFLPDGVLTPVQLVLDGSDYKLFARNLDSPWQLHSRGRVSRTETYRLATIDLGEWRIVCDQEISTEEYYRCTHEAGIEHGEHFQAIQALWRSGSGDRVLARLCLPENITGAGFLLHPVLLDAAFQMLGVPLLERGDLYLPVGLSRFDLLRLPDTKVWCVVSVTRLEGPLVTADLSLIDDNGEVFVQIKELRFQRASRALLQRNSRFAHQDWLYSIEWQRQLREVPSVGWLPEPCEIRSSIMPTIQSAVDAMVGFAEFWPVLDRLAAAYAKRALASVDEVRPEHFALATRFRAIILEEPDLPDPDELSSSIEARFPDAKIERILVEQCGKGLADVLSGQQSGLGLLFPGGEFDVAGRIYTDSPGSKAINNVLQAAISEITAVRPEGCALRVLEIGAGTGGSTDCVLPILANPNAGCVEYAFTDISPLFLARAKKRYTAHGFINYQQLDIEREPQTQGIIPGYHIVIAANVLHATQDLRQTLAHAASMLAPGGMLLLVEGLGPQPWLDISFGLTDGWWRFKDAELRNGYPLLDSLSWTDLLKESGFLDVEVLSPDSLTAKPLLRQAVMMARKPVVALENTWLILADRSGLVESLREAGLSCRVLSAEAPITTGSLSAHMPCAGVLFARGLDAVDPQGAETACAEFLDLIQGLNALQTFETPRLVTLTRNASDDTNPAQAPLWAMAQVAAVEHPELCCRRVDIGNIFSATDIIEELGMLGGEETVALRETGRCVPRISIPEQSEEPAIVIRSEASVIITGGLGGLGIATARWLVETQGVLRLVLASRRSLGEVDDEVVSQVQAIKALGATVDVVVCDVTVMDQVIQLITVAEREGPLGGVIHAAGVMDDGMLAGQSKERLLHVLAPKVRGGWNLHHACAGRHLDFFILFASLSGVVGPTSQASHAAANAYLDGLARWRRSQGVPAMSIDWGAWSDIGYASHNNIGDRLASRGVDSITSSEGFEVFKYLLAHPATQVVVAPIRWDVFLEQNGDATFYERWRSEQIKDGDTMEVQLEHSNWLEELRAAPAGAQRNRIRERIQLETKLVLGHDAASKIGDDDGFFDLGVDSLIAVELQDTLQSAFACSLPSTVLFKYPNIGTLTDYIMGMFMGSPNAEILEEKPTAFLATSAVSAIQVAEVQEMSEDELTLLINAELDDLSED